MDDGPGWSGFDRSFTLAKKSNPRKFPQTLDDFPEEQGLHLVVPDSPPHQKFSSESPLAHTPITKRAAHKIEPEKQVVASPSHVGTTGQKTEEPITVGPKRLPDSPFPKRISPIPYHKPCTPYRRVDLPSGEIASETAILDKTDDSFETDSESERTLIEEPREPKTPKIQSSSEMPEGITKRK